ncbi:MAG TPA: hypothetical protein PLZ57_04920 [Pseudobdellovibrionaceae bacterium]|nr:hypothetical protein [Pseudobdellovibrionaceae bacterium]
MKAADWGKTLKLGLAAIATMGTLSLMTACGGGGGGGGGGPVVDPGYGAWYDVYGRRCGYSPSPGCNFYANGMKIIDIEDPYFRGTYYLEFDSWHYLDSYGFPSTYIGWAWQSPNGIIYDDFGDALNETDGQGRDFAADVAELEQNAVKTAGEFFAAKYQLDAATGMKVARALNDWATIGKDRARTERDIADFTQRLYGVDFNKVKGALAEAMKGERGEMEALVDQAATNWSTTPETMKEILKTWYGQQADVLF